MINLNNLLITLDGPAGSGKQRIAKYIAKKFRLFHLDSGILYRRLAKIIFNQKIDYKNDKELKNFLAKIKKLSCRTHKNLRTEKTGLITSQIATNSKIRIFINLQQKIIVSEMILKYRGVIIDGRDIGSKVFKNAKIKLFVEVKPEIRAKRRHKQLIGLGEKSIYAQILKEIKLRDNKDMQRAESPLIVPKNSIIIDNSNNFDQTIKQINNIMKNI